MLYVVYPGRNRDKYLIRCCWVESWSLAKLLVCSCSWEPVNLYDPCDCTRVQRFYLQLKKLSSIRKKFTIFLNFFYLLQKFTSRNFLFLNFFISGKSLFHDIMLMHYTLAISIKINKFLYFTFKVWFQMITDQTSPGSSLRKY